MSNSGVYNNIIAVDDHDNVIAAMPKSEAIEKGYNCRASRAFVFNEGGKVLLQRRSKNVSRPLLLDHSMAGHVDAGETYLMAAERELREELSIGSDQYPLREVEKPFLVGGFFGALIHSAYPEQGQLGDRRCWIHIWRGPAASSWPRQAGPRTSSRWTAALRRSLCCSPFTH